MKRWTLAAVAAVAAVAATVAALSLGCATIEDQQRSWIFQPSDRSWGGSASEAVGMQELGFSVLAIDYRGFGKSTAGLPSEDMAYEDAQKAWDWLAARYPQRPRYIFGHSLGGAIAIDLAAKVPDERGTIVEGTFTSMADVASTMKWGWLPIGPLITQRFDSVHKVGKLGAPLLVVHGDSDNLINVEQGRKRFVLVKGGSHFSTMAVGLSQYRQALADLFSLH